MFKPHVQDQGELFPPRVGDLIPEHDLCRVVSEVVERLDLSAFVANYSQLGQNAYSPRTMLKLLLFGYAQGVRASRAIEDRVSFDVRYRWLAGKDRPGKSAIAEFRTRNLAAIEELFVQVVLLCRELGMLKFGQWAIDGTKLKACSGKGAMRRRDKIENDLSVEVSEHEDVIKAMRERLSSDQGRKDYAKRKQSVEPVFGVAKWVMGFSSFLLRGLSKVRGEWRLAMAAFNIRKIWSSTKPPKTPA